MGKKDNKDLLKFLKAFPAETRTKVSWLREFVWDMYPQANELIYDNYNALAFGWSITGKLSDSFCSIAVMRTGTLHFGFYWGSKIKDPKKILKGEGNQYRYIYVTELDEFPVAAIRRLIQEAYSYAFVKMKPVANAPAGTTTTRGISTAKRAPAKKKPKKK